VAEAAALERLLDPLAELLNADVVAAVRRGLLPRAPPRAVARTRERRPLALPSAAQDALLAGLMGAPGPLVVDEAASSPDVRRSAWLGAQGLRSMLLVPVLVDGEAAAVVVVFARERARFAPADLARVEPFAGAAAGIVQSA
jgi:GAF domain-containing protein